MDAESIRILWVQSGMQVCDRMVRLKDHLYAMFGIMSDALGLPSDRLVLPNSEPDREEHKRLREGASVLQAVALHFSTCVPLVRVLNVQVLTAYGQVVRSRLPVEEIRKVEQYREDHLRFNHQKMLTLAKFMMTERDEREGTEARLQA